MTEKKRKFLSSCAKHGLDTEEVKEKLEGYESINQMVREEDNQMLTDAMAHANRTGGLIT